MRFLNGKELAGFIKERQAKQVRGLRQAHGVQPKLAIVMTDLDNKVIDIYVRMKKRYGEDILIDVDIHKVEQTSIRELLNTLSNDEKVHGIIVQLPLSDMSEADEILALVNSDKDVDGLAPDSSFEPATALAIMWLLAGYNINMLGKKVVLVGHGKLVGQPLERLLLADQITPTIVDINTPNSETIIKEADILVSATGVAGLIKPAQIKQGAVVVDAGVASEGGKTVGDVSPEVYERADLTITPIKGGVGPLTVCALFDNVIRAAQRMADQQKI
jgi:methylenetetrahydrofolate dehydrogenase (NADP+)/methenyltetrahydrofolate cyclohydrolase